MNGIWGTAATMQWHTSYMHATVSNLALSTDCFFALFISPSPSLDPQSNCATPSSSSFFFDWPQEYEWL
jgi:hypothetical protein